MAKSWRKRATKRLFGWMGRIEGVEKPAILVAFGLILFRAWQGRKTDPAAVRASGGARDVIHRMKDRLSRAWHGRPSASDSDSDSDDADDPVHFAPLPADKDQSPPQPEAPR